VDIDAIHKALASPVRRRILAWLKDPQRHFCGQQPSLDLGVSAGLIDRCSGLSQSTVSAHLATLQKAGLVSSRKVGQWSYFKRDDAAIQAFVDYMKTGL
jgi:ArsR family transcriptional regulator